MDWLLFLIVSLSVLGFFLLCFLFFKMYVYLWTPPKKEEVWEKGTVQPETPPPLYNRRFYLLMHNVVYHEPVADLEHNAKKILGPHFFKREENESDLRYGDRLIEKAKGLDADAFMGIIWHESH